MDRDLSNTHAHRNKGKILLDISIFSPLVFVVLFHSHILHCLLFQKNLCVASALLMEHCMLMKCAKSA